MRLVSVSCLSIAVCAHIAMSELEIPTEPQSADPTASDAWAVRGLGVALRRSDVRSLRWQFEQKTLRLLNMLLCALLALCISPWELDVSAVVALYVMFTPTVAKAPV